MKKVRTSFNISGLNKEKIKVCKQCGKEYIGFSNTRYCSSACSNMNSYESKMFIKEYRINKLMCMAKNRAKTKGLDYNLSLDFLVKLWDSTGGCCPLTGLTFELGRPEKGKVHPYAPSIDRVVPELGYTEGNVRFICYQMNVALSEFGIEQFEKLVRAYANVAWR